MQDAHNMYVDADKQLRDCHTSKPYRGVRSCLNVCRQKGRPTEVGSGAVHPVKIEHGACI